MANDSSNSATVELHAVDGPRFHASMAKALRASTEVLPQFYREMMAGMARSGAFTALRPAFLAYGED